MSFFPIRPHRSSVMVAASLLGLVTAAQAQTAQTAPLAPAVPQTPGFSSKPVIAEPITGVEGKEVVLISVTLEPGASSPPHSHPGDCIGFIYEGTIEMRAAGKEPKRYSAGDSYSNLGGVHHQFTNVGDKPVRLINTLVVEKGKPRTVPQPVVR